MTKHLVTKVTGDHRNSNYMQYRKLDVDTLEENILP